MLSCFVCLCLVLVLFFDKEIARSKKRAASLSVFNGNVPIDAVGPEGWTVPLTKLYPLSSKAKLLEFMTSELRLSKLRF